MSSHHHNSQSRISPFWIIIFTILLCSVVLIGPALAYSTSTEQLDTTTNDSGSMPASPDSPPSAQSRKIYLPAVIQANSNLLMLGIYIPGYSGYQSVIDSQLKPLDAWTGKQHSIVGLFVDLRDGNPAWNIPMQLETLYQNGYTAFINLQANNTMAQIARGDIDTYIHNTAKAYATWAKQGGDRMAFIAPFTEMNGDWTYYGGDPLNFKRGYQRVRDIFNQEGVPPDSTLWVFGPNGWSIIPFEDFYPGDALVDLNAFSSYNYGYCDAIDPWQDWKTPATVYGEYIQRMKVMAPTKPIIIAQTATTGLNSSGSDTTAKNKWLTDALNYLASDRYVRAFIYVNLKLECDWPIYTPSGVRFSGYPEGAKNPWIMYKSPFDMKRLSFTIQN